MPRRTLLNVESSTSMSYLMLVNVLFRADQMGAPFQSVRPATSPAGGLAGELVAAFGGPANIQSLDACVTRLRVQLADPGLANPARLKALGATGVVTVGNNLRATFGTRSENLKSDKEEYLRAGGGQVPSLAADVCAAASAPASAPG